MSLLLGIDLGTSYFKVGLFDAAGVLKGLGRVAVEKDVSVPGRQRRIGAVKQHEAVGL